MYLARTLSAPVKNVLSFSQIEMSWLDVQAAGGLSQESSGVSYLHPEIWIGGLADTAADDSHFDTNPSLYESSTRVGPRHSAVKLDIEEPSKINVGAGFRSFGERT